MSWSTLMTVALCALASQAGSPKSPAASASPSASTAPVLPSFLDVSLSDFDDAAGYPTAERLKQLFSPVPGQKFELGKASFADRDIQMARGWFRLHGGLPDGAMLRFSIVNNGAPMRWYFWRGREGLLFVYYPNADGVCALYAIARGGDKPEPECYQLVALDEGRYVRAGRGTLAAMVHQGRLAFLCGDVWLFDAPLGGPPGEIFLQCEGQVRGVDVVACRGGPAPRPARSLVWRWDRPAEVAWEPRLPEKVSIRKLADGAVELAAEAKSQAAQIDAPLDLIGPAEIVFELDEASPGTGVFLADAEGNRLVQIGCLEDGRSKQPFLALQPGGDTTDSQWRDLGAQPVAHTASRHWVSLVGGATVWRLGFSPDGEHFTYSHETQRQGKGTPARVGVYCVAREQPRAIRLRSVRVRRLDALEAIRPEPIRRATAGNPAGTAGDGAAPTIADTLEALPAPDEPEAIEEWLSAIDQHRPEGVAAPAWRRAVLLASLSSRHPRGAKQAILLRLVDEMIDDPDAPPERALAALGEMVLLVPAEDRRWGEAYARLGAAMMRRGHASPYSMLWSSMLFAPLGPAAYEPIGWENLLAAELAPLMYAYRWTDVDALCRRVQRALRVRRRASDLPKWQRPLDQLSDWAWANVPRRISGWSARPAREPRAYGPLGTATIHKEAFNTMAEVEAALRSGNVADACQVIAEAARVPATGLTSFSPDPRLYLCFAAAIRAWVERAPKLGEAIEQQHGQLARLRFQAAAAAGDVALAESVVVQFPATQAATEAQQWLGDAALSAGRFAEASGYYRRALQRATPEQAAGLAARLRLAGALVGFPAGGPSRSGVQLGDARFSAAQFDELVADLAGARGAAAMLRWQNIGTALAPAAGRYRLELRGRIDGSAVAVPDGHPDDDESFDFGARQTSTVVLGDAMVVANRALVAAYNLSDGSPRWRQVLQGDGNQQSWPLQPFHLAVAEDRLLVRRLTEAGPELCCLSAADGNVLWTAALGGMAVSDAMLGDRDAYVFQLRRSFSSRLSLELVRIDVDSGYLLDTAPLIELNDALGDRLICQSRLLRDRIVATIGGCTLCCDLQGRLRWLRHAVWAPPREPGAYYAQCYRQVHDVPLVKDDQLFAFQPGMFGVECLDLETGVLRWQRVLPGIERLVGVSDARLVVATRDELLALGPDGRVLWRHETPRRFELFGCGAEAIVYARSERTDDAAGPRRPELVWLDAATGRELACCTLDAPNGGATMVGPLVVHEKRQWVFLGRPDAPAGRELFELLPGA